MTLDGAHCLLDSRETLLENFTLYRRCLTERQQDLTSELQPSNQAWQYLVWLGEKALGSTLSDEAYDEIHDFSVALFSHIDQFLEIYEATTETQKQSETLISAVYQDLPAALQTRFKQDAQSLTPDNADDRTGQETRFSGLRIPPNLVPKIYLKQKVIGKNLVRALSVCAALSLPASEKQWPEGPAGAGASPDQLMASVQHLVEETAAPDWTKVEAYVPQSPPTALPEAEAGIPFERLQQTKYPVEVVANQAPDIAHRLNFVLQHPERRALLKTLRSNPHYRHDIALLGIIESNLNPDAISHAGAMGPLQDMGGLQGAFGDPETIDSLARAGLLPEIDNPTYNRIINLLKRGVEIQRGTLLEFLKKERNQNTELWQQFLEQQKTLLTNPETAAHIADLYLDDLADKALTQLPLNHDPLEALNFAVMSYNLGRGHLHTLRRIMMLNGVYEFNTYTVLSFMDRDDFAEILRKNNLSQLHNNYEEAKNYLARYIALQEILHHNDSRI